MGRSARGWAALGEQPAGLGALRRLVRARWRYLAVVAVAGVVVGAVAGLVVAPGYAATSKVLLLGTLDQAQVVSEAQVAMSRVVADRAADRLKWGASGEALQGSVTADVVNGKVIEIRGTARTPQQAHDLTAAMMDAYVAFSSQIATESAAAVAQETQRTRDGIRARIDEANRQITQLTTADPAAARSSEVGRLNQLVAEGTQQLQTLDSREASTATGSAGKQGLSIIEPATLPSHAASPTMLEIAVGTGLAAVVAAVLLAFARLQRDERLRSPADIAAATGAPALGAITVARSHPGDRRSLRDRIIRDDRGWADPVPARTTAPDRRIAVRRTLQRSGVLVAPAERTRIIVFDDDPAAVPVAVLLADCLATEWGGAVLLTDRPEVAGLLAEDPGSGRRLRVAAAEGGLEPELVLVVVDPARPVLTDARAGESALLAVGVGVRTAPELATVAAACTDAGLRLLGVAVGVRGEIVSGEGAAPAADRSGDESVAGTS